MSTVTRGLFPLSILLLFHLIQAFDVFCGNLSVFEQQRFGRNSVAISSQETTDLKQCLEVCCSVLNCHGVSFIGIISVRSNEPNCLLVGCKGECELNPRADYQDGVISVVLHRTPQAHSQNMSSDADVVNSTWTSGDSPSSVGYMSPPSTTTSLVSEAQALAPVWAVGLAIVIAVVCVGLNLSLLSAYICYRRKQSRKQTAQISTIKGPTLHAYNHGL